MPGVFRPYTLIDILGALNGQSSQASNGTSTIDGIGYVGEVDETSISTDTASTLLVATSAQVWDQAQWGAVSWS